MANRIGVAMAAVSVLAVAACSGPPQVEGKVEAVDLTKNTVILGHDAIPNIPMPAMTMMFNVVDPSALAPLKQGDQVRFTVEVVDGALTVTSIKLE